MKFILSILVFITILISLVSCSHFRYGTFSWFVTDPFASPSTITFRVATAWRNSFFNVPLNDYIIPGSFCYSNDTVCVSFTSQKTAEYLADDWLVSNFGPGFGITPSTLYTNIYPNTYAYHVASFYSCCRIGSLQNNPHSNWHISGTIIINPGNQALQSIVSNTLPIISIPFGVQTATYSLIAIHPTDNTKINYRMATSYELDRYSAVHPSSLFIKDNVKGELQIDTTGLVINGLYTTQQIITDTLTGNSIPIDYILFVRKVDTFCDPSCVNRLTACTSSSQCVGCAAALTITCITSRPLIITDTLKISPPTTASNLIPENGEIINFSPNSQIDLYIIAHDEVISNPTKFVDIYNSGLPPNSTLTVQSSCTAGVCECTNGYNCNQPQYRIFRWYPLSTNLGDYSLCIGVRSTDGNELSYSQHCITIRIAFSVCGSGTNIGTPIAPICTCPNGFNSTKNCQECDPGFYGDNCLPCPNCNNGICDDGLFGSGTCTCSPGWTQASNCLSPIIQSCDPLRTTNVVSTSKTSSLVNPSSAIVFVQNPSNTLYSLPISINIPLLPILDLIILFDISSITSIDVGKFNEFISRFITDSINYATSTIITIGTFSDNINSYKKISSSTSSATQLSSSIKSIVTSFNTNPSYTLESIDSAINDQSTTLRSASTKVIAVFTNKDYTTTNSKVQLNEFQFRLARRGFVPIFISKSIQNNPYDSLINTIQFGSSNLNLNSDSSTWHSLLSYEITKVFGQASLILLNDTILVLSALPTRIDNNSPGSTVPFNIDFKIPFSVPNSAIVNIPIIKISSPGWGFLNIFTSINRPPTSQSAKFSLSEDIPFPFGITANDPDNNILKINFISLPSTGAITINNVNVVTGTAYDLIGFTYTPAPNDFTINPYSFSYTITDGCDTIGPITSTFSISPINDPPTCVDITLNANEDTDLTIDFSGKCTDVDDSSITLTYQVTQLPDRSYGILYDSNNNLITTSTSITSSVIFRPSKDAFGVVPTFTYVSIDPSSSTSNNKNIIVTINPVNDAPTISANSTYISALRGDNSISIELYLEDADLGDTLTLYVQENFIYLPNVKDNLNKGPYTSILNIQDGNIITSIASYTPIKNTTILSSQSTTLFGLFNHRKTVIFNWNLDNTCTTGNCIDGPFSIFFYVNDNNGVNSNVLEVVTQVLKGPPPKPSPVTFYIDEDNLLMLDPYSIDGADADVRVNVSRLTSILIDNDNVGGSGNLYNGLNIISTVDTPVNIIHTTGSTNYSTLLNYVPTPNFNGEISFSLAWTNKEPATAYQSYKIIINPINDAPTGSNFSIIINEESVTTINQFYPVDVDNSSTQLSIRILSLPNGNFTDNNGNNISINDSFTTFSFTYNPPMNAYSLNGSEYTNFNFQYFDGLLYSPIYTCSIVVNNINDLPTSNNTYIYLKKNRIVNITIPSFDFDLEDYPTHRVKVTSLNNRGKLYLDSVGTKNLVNSTNYETSKGLNLVFNPSILTEEDNDALWDPLIGEITSDNYYTSFTFRVFESKPNGQADSILEYNVFIWVQDIHEDQEMTVDEDEVLSIFLLSNKLRLSSARSTVLSLPDRGYIFFEDQNDAATENIFNTVPLELNAVRFRGNLNENGQNYTRILFNLLKDSTSINYTITINVLPVNDIPTVSSLVNLPVKMYEDTYTVIAFNASDLEDNLSELTAFVEVPDYGYLYFCANETTNIFECDIGQKINSSVNTSSIMIPQFSNPGSWHLIFAPEPNSYKNSYITLDFIVKDSNGGVVRLFTRIDVNPVNDPPVITLESDIFSTNVGNPVVIGANSSIYDIDVLTKPMRLEITLIYGNGSINVSADSFTFNIKGSSFCNITEEGNFINCTASIRTLNSTLHSLIYTPTGEGAALVNVYVNDLGSFGTSLLGLPIHLSDNKNISIDSTPRITQTSSQDLTAAIGGAAAAGIILAALAALAARKFLEQPPDEFFNAFDNSASTDVVENPLYDNEGRSGNNPIFEGNGGL